MGMYCFPFNESKKEYIKCPVEWDKGDCCDKYPLLITNICYSQLLAFKILVDGWGGDIINFAIDADIDGYIDIKKNYKNVSIQSIKNHNNMFKERYGKDDYSCLIHPDHIKLNESEK